MAYVPVPKDLSKIKTKVAFNLTKRQIICFAAALAMGLPLFFLLKDSAGTSMAAFAMIVVMLPCFLLAMYSLLCKWFRIAVLPLDKLLYAELYQTEDRKKCTVCGAFFASTSNSVKYCPDCRKRITRRQAAERMRKRRALVTR